MSLDVEEARAAAAEAEAALGGGRPASARPSGRARRWSGSSARCCPSSTGRWVEERRAELEALHSDALETLARAALRLGGGELPAAERAARTLIAARALPRVRLRRC